MEVYIHGTLNKQPIKTHKLKKHVKDRNKAGRASMVPPSLDQPSKRSRLDFAEDAPQSVPGRNMSCTSTFPGESQRPPSCPQRGSGADQGDDWQVDDGTYDRAYDGSYYGDSWHGEPHRRVTPYYEDRRFEEHAPLPYGHQPSSQSYIVLEH
jgi:hypothetical protein